MHKAAFGLLMLVHAHPALPATCEEQRRETVFHFLDNTNGAEVDTPAVSRADTSPDLEVRWISTKSGARIFTQTAGSGVPLVLVPGGPGNSSHSFHPDFSALHSSALVHYYDPVGVGRSDARADRAYTVENAVEDLETLRQAFGHEQLVLLGHSWGGFLAQAYAQKYPDRIKGLILVGSLYKMRIDDGDGERVFHFLLPQERERIRQIFAIGENNILGTRTNAVDQQTLTRRLFNATLNGDWKRQYFCKPSFERMAQIALFEWVHDANYNSLMSRDTQTYDHSGKFIRTPYPVMIVEGRWDPVFGPEKTSSLQEQFPEARFEILLRSSHFPFREEPEEFFAKVENFLDGLR